MSASNINSGFHGHADVKAGADSETINDEKKATPLLMPVGQNSFEAMCALLRHGANPNAKDPDGDTALHIICISPKYGFQAAVEQLLLRSADETVQDCDGYTPADNLDVHSQRFSMMPDQEGSCPEEIHRVRVTLALALVRRAWQSRGWLIVLRSRAQRGATRRTGTPGGNAWHRVRFRSGRKSCR